MFRMIFTIMKRNMLKHAESRRKNKAIMGHLQSSQALQLLHLLCGRMVWFHFRLTSWIRRQVRSFTRRLLSGTSIYHAASGLKVNLTHIQSKFNQAIATIATTMVSIQTARTLLDSIKTTEVKRDSSLLISYIWWDSKQA